MKKIIQVGYIQGKHFLRTHVFGYLGRHTSVDQKEQSTQYLREETPKYHEKEDDQSLELTNNHHCSDLIGPKRRELCVPLHKFVLESKLPWMSKIAIVARLILFPRSSMNAIRRTCLELGYAQTVRLDKGKGIRSFARYLEELSSQEEF